MKIVYASRTGNVESFVSRLKGYDTLKIELADEKVNEDYVLITYTDGYGDAPVEVISFIDNNKEFLKGVISSGDSAYGEAFTKSADFIAENYNVPILHRFENDGTDEDLKIVEEKIKTL